MRTRKIIFSLFTKTFIFLMTACCCKEKTTPSQMPFSRCYFFLLRLRVSKITAPNGGTVTSMV